MIKPKFSFTKRFDDSSILERTLKELKRYQAKAGFLVSAGTHPNSNLPIATIAVYNEFGTPNARHPIPARPFLRPVFKDTRTQKDLLMKLLPKTVFEKSGERLRKTPNVKRLFTLYAMQMVSQIQKMIRSNVPPENAEWTKIDKGPLKTKTLINTNAMLQAVSFEVTE